MSASSNSIEAPAPLAPQEATNASRPVNKDRRWLALAALLVILVLAGTMRWRYLDTPLERDEGEFGYGAQRLLAGEVPYVSIHAMKLPGIYFAYALIVTAFGQTAWGIHFGLLLTNLASIVLVYCIGRKLIDELTGLGGAAAFALFTLSPSVLGTQAQAEHFVVLPMLIGMLLLLTANDRLWLLFLAGIAFGLALVTKQHGATFGLAGIAYCAWLRNWKGLAVLTLGWLLPLGLICLTFWLLDAWEPFVFWTWTYPREYSTPASPSVACNFFKNSVTDQFQWQFALWIAAAVGLFMPKSQRGFSFVLIWLLASIAAIMPGGLFRSHYFVLVIPVAAILAGCAGSRSRITAVLFVAAMAWSAWDLGRFYLPLSPTDLVRSLYIGSCFADSPEIAQHLAELATPEQSIGIIGSEPQLLFYSKRRSASPHIYMYPLMESHEYAIEMQRELIADIEAARPPLIVLANDPISWLRNANSPNLVVEWTDRYLAENYYEVGRVEYFWDKPNLLTWGTDLHETEPTSPRWLGIYRRKAGL